MKEKFTGFAINMNGAANTATVDFTIERWSTDAERTKLLALVPEEHKDPQKLVDALQDMKSVGSIRTPQTLAWDLRYAREFKIGRGRPPHRPRDRSSDRLPGGRQLGRAAWIIRSPSSRFA